MFFSQVTIGKFDFFLATDGAAITNSLKVFSSMKIFNFLQGLVGFGNLCFAELKSCPTYELRKVEISPNIK